MHDFVSKLTFGFVMAQLVPGAVVVYCSTLAFMAYAAGTDESLNALMVNALDFWFRASISAKVIFLGLATGAGMALHGLNWGVLGFLENRHKLGRSDDEQPRPASESFWHNYPLALQILLGPIKLVLEVLMVLFTPLRGHYLRDLAIEENVAKVPEKKIAAFQFLQDFYLHFAQFYAHTSYALVAAFLSLLLFMCVSQFSWKAVTLAALFYMMAGFFFVIGRIQFASLFKAEWSLTEESSKPPRRNKKKH